MFIISHSCDCFRPYMKYKRNALAELRRLDWRLVTFTTMWYYI